MLRLILLRSRLWLRLLCFTVHPLWFLLDVFAYALNPGATILVPRVFPTSCILYTKKYPLCIFAQRLALFSAYSSMSLDVYHIPGEHNADADMRSRITDFAELERFSLDDRLILDLEQLWFRRSAVSLSPPDFPLHCKIPTNGLFL